jgi:hypothetical protein
MTHFSASATFLSEFYSFFTLLFRRDVQRSNTRSGHIASTGQQAVTEQA